MYICVYARVCVYFCDMWLCVACCSVSCIFLLQLFVFVCISFRCRCRLLLLLLQHFLCKFLSFPACHFIIRFAQMNFMLTNLPFIHRSPSSHLFLCRFNCPDDCSSVNSRRWRCHCHCHCHCSALRESIEILFFISMYFVAVWHLY